MKRWRFFHNWRSYHGIGGFALFSLWWSKDYIGFGLCNFAVEYSRHQTITVDELQQRLKSLRDDGMDV